MLYEQHFNLTSPAMAFDLPGHTDINDSEILKQLVLYTWWVSYLYCSQSSRPKTSFCTYCSPAHKTFHSFEQCKDLIVSSLNCKITCKAIKCQKTLQATSSPWPKPSTLRILLASVPFFHCEGPVRADCLVRSHLSSQAHLRPRLLKPYQIKNIELCPFHYPHLLQNHNS